MVSVHGEELILSPSTLTTPTQSSLNHPRWLQKKKSNFYCLEPLDALVYPYSSQGFLNFGTNDTWS